MARQTHYDHSEPVDVRVQISALWIAMLFVFSYVDLFSLYRPDVRAGLEAGTLSAFDVNETFLLVVTLYIAIPSLMVFLTLVMRPGVNRMINMIVAGVYGLTVVGSAIGEWSYFVFGSVVEGLLLALIVHRAWTWPKRTI